MEHRTADGAGRAGHRGIPHTADLRVEAWGPSREECLAQAVHGVVEAFVDPAGAAVVGRREAALAAERDEDLLAGLMDELVYRLDADGEVPVEVRLEATPAGARAVLGMAEAAALPLVGAVPKAVTLHGLSCDGGPGGWTCAATLDV